MVQRLQSGHAGRRPPDVGPADLLICTQDRRMVADYHVDVSGPERRAEVCTFAFVAYRRNDNAVWSKCCRLLLREHEMVRHDFR